MADHVCTDRCLRIALVFHSFTNTYVYTYEHTHVRMYAHTHTHVYIYMYIYIYIFFFFLLLLLFLLFCFVKQKQTYIYIYIYYYYYYLCMNQHCRSAVDDGAKLVELSSPPCTSGFSWLIGCLTRHFLEIFVLSYATKCEQHSEQRCEISTCQCSGHRPKLQKKMMARNLTWKSDGLLSASIVKFGESHWEPLPGEIAPLPSFNHSDACAQQAGTEVFDIYSPRTPLHNDCGGYAGFVMDN